MILGSKFNGQGEKAIGIIMILGSQFNGGGTSTGVFEVHLDTKGSNWNELFVVEGPKVGI